MNKISFKLIKEHFEEHFYDNSGITIADQIAILIDGKNLFPEHKFGMFPSDFFSQDKHFFDGKLQVGICGCSCYECGDKHIDVNSTNDTVVWSTGPYVNRTEYIFNKNEYTEIINKSIEKYVDKELYSKINEIILKELKNAVTKTGFVYSMFRLYNYGTTIIIYFKTNDEEDNEEKYYKRWNDETEEIFYIRWNGNIEILIKEINEIKKNQNIQIKSINKIYEEQLMNATKSLPF